MSIAETTTTITLRDEIKDAVHKPAEGVAANVKVLQQAAAIPTTPPIILGKTPASYKLPLPVPLPTRENFAETHFWRNLNMGLPGTGKTRMACLTLPDDMYPAALVDVDDKGSDMVELIPLRQEGKLLIYRVNSPLIGEEEDFTKRVTTSDAILQSAPGGIEETLNIVNGIIRQNNLVRKGELKDTPIIRTIILDTLSRLAEHASRTVEFIQQMKAMGTSPAEAKFGADWKKFKNLLEELVSKLIKSKMNVIVNCHLQERVKLVGTSEVVSYRPAIEGAFRDVLVSHFNEAYIMKSQLQKKDEQHAEAWTQYLLETQANGKVVARTNIKDLPRIIAPNLKPVIRKWRKQMGVED